MSAKYEIKTNAAGFHELWRYDESRGLPNNVELQFWQEREAAREEIVLLQAKLAFAETALRKLVEDCPCDNDGLGCPCEDAARAALGAMPEHCGLLSKAKDEVVLEARAWVGVPHHDQITNAIQKLDSLQ